MGFRNLVIGDETWRYVIGVKNCDIRAPDGKRSFKPLCSDVKGIPAKEFEDGKIDGDANGMIGPGDIAVWIKTNCQ